MSFDKHLKEDMAESAFILNQYFPGPAYKLASGNNMNKDNKHVNARKYMLHGD